MVKQEYTLEEISYSRKEDCRIMESVLLQWFSNPKTLNYVSPRISYPFKFKKWLSIFYLPTKNKIITIVLKHNNWIIGHMSLDIYSTHAEIFHFIIDKQYRRKGLGKKMLLEIENHAVKVGIETIISNVIKKNSPAIQFFKNSGYKEANENITSSVKFSKKF